MPTRSVSRYKSLDIVRNKGQGQKKGSEIIQVDALIIGAGPIGGYLAMKLCHAGHTVLMVEEHDQIEGLQCAGFW